MAEEIKASVPVIDRVIELQPARLLEVDGFTHIDKDKCVILFKPPVLSALEIKTLSGFVGLLEVGFEGFDATQTVIHVDAFDAVSLIAKGSDKYGRRQSFVTAKALKPERNFQFNTFIPQEEFNIALRSMFVEDDAVASLIKVSGNLAAQAEARQEDDGFTQTVTAKAGVVRVTEITVRPRVTLRPFRTFTEVEQPAGDFIFRIKVGERGNLLALFEADGGAWKLTAMNTIRTWLQNQLHVSNVKTLNDLPVIA